VAFIPAFVYSAELYDFLARPVISALPAGSKMIATGVITPFLIPMKIALLAAFLAVLPYVLYQAWAFIAPGMYRHEKRFAVPLMVSSILLFYSGVAFAYLVVCPLVFAFITSTTPEGVTVMTDINRYLDFVLAMFFAFGLAFEVPVATVLLVWAGLTTPESLVAKRPYIVVGCFVVGMVLTPPDILSQTLLAVPMWLLFEVGVVASRALLRRRTGDAGAPDEA